MHGQNSYKFIFIMLPLTLGGWLKKNSSFQIFHCEVLTLDQSLGDVILQSSPKQANLEILYQ